MKTSKNKLIALALVTILTATATITTCLPIATAQKTEATAYLAFRPDPIGVNQELLVNAWVSPPPPLNLTDFTGIPRTDYMFYFTDPDGNIDTVGPLTSTGEGATWFIYIPNKVGDWTVKFSWAGDADFTACETEEQPLTVQQDPIPSWPAAPLPTDEPWDYPINPENREWYQISGSWSQHHLMGYNASRTNFNPYSQAPSSSHILWKLTPPEAEGIGGLIGGEFGTGPRYPTSDIRINNVMAGRGYYQSGGTIYCLDIRTGEELWATPGSFTQCMIDTVPIYIEWGGELIEWGEPKIVPTLISIGSQLIKYNALTGEVLLNETGIDIEGEWHFLDNPYVYTFDIPNNQLIKWSCYGSATDFSERVIWNITVPWPSHEEFVIYEDIIASILGGYSWWFLAGAINATTGEELWISADLPFMTESPNPTAAYGKAFYPSLNRHYAAVNLRTGETEWLSEETDYPWGTFWAYGTAAAYDMVYGGGYYGVYAFNQSTGAIVWHYSTGDSGYETPYGTWPVFDAPLIADGKVYAATGEHTPTYPTYRGQKLHCINAWNGDPIWSIMGYYLLTAVAEGTLFTTNTYDGCAYAFAKGETATTVSLTKSQISKGEVVGITGTVMDMSPAQPGTPAVSKESMSGWMEYLHMQQPAPHDVTGVPVHLYAVHSDGTAVDIGSTTTNYNGIFSHAWTPPDEGAYIITAKFDTDESYYSSFAETALAVGPEPAAHPEPDEAAEYTTVDLAIIVAVAIAIVIGIANLWALRKRK